MWRRAFAVILVSAVASGCHKRGRASDRKPTPPTPHYQLGQTVKFGRDGNSLLYKGGGWGDTERDSTWTNGHAARLEFVLANTGQPLRLRMRLTGLTDPPRLNFQTVEVVVNDESVAEWQVSDTADYIAIIPAQVTDHERLIIDLRVPEAVSPKALGISDDTRLLGISCADLDLTAASSVASDAAAQERSTAVYEGHGWTYRLGSWEHLGIGAGAQRFKVAGWYPAEREFTWTGKGPAVLHVTVPAAEGALTLTVRASGLIAPEKIPAQPTEVYVQGEKVGEWQVGAEAEYSATIPRRIVKKGEELRIELRVPRATSPAALGLSLDKRELGIRCEAFRLDAAPSGASSTAGATPPVETASPPQR